ncbi:MAG: putative D-alanyl-D-alanine carboxypeptidase [Actinomycetota bacterium]
MKRLVNRVLGRLRTFDQHVAEVETQRAAVSIIVAAAVLFVPLFSAWQVTRSAAGTAAPQTIAMSVDPPPWEPVFSVRRIARTAAIEARVAKVRTRLSSLVPNLPADSCLVVRAESRAVVAVRAQRALIPASNMKLLVAAAALDVLGPDYRFTTAVIGTRSGANVLGNMWLVGGGDPLLSTRAYPPTQVYSTLAPTYLDSLADALAETGIISVTGSVVGDESRYDAERYVSTWGDGIRSIEAGPLGALMVDDGVLVGEPFKPANPAVGAATALTRLLTARNVRVFAAPRSGLVSTAPASATELARITSAPLSSILVDLLTNSDNNAAELLLKEIGLVRKQQPTRVAGLQVIAEVLEARGIDTAGIVLADGSGLDGGNRVSCGLLVALLESYGLASPLGQALAVAGTSGTLRDQLTTGPARGRVVAKTGTLRIVKSLSGFYPVSDTPRVTSGSTVDAVDSLISFALILNGTGVSNQSAYRPIWNDLMQAMSGFSNEPVTPDLLPRQP